MTGIVTDQRVVGANNRLETHSSYLVVPPLPKCKGQCKVFSSFVQSNWDALPDSRETAGVMRSQRSVDPWIFCLGGFSQAGGSVDP